MRWAGAFRRWGDAVSYQVSRRKGATSVLVLGGAGSVALSPPDSGGSGIALVAATALLTSIYMVGAVGGELRSGRVLLGVGAAGSVGRCLARESAARLAALGTALLALVGLAAVLLVPRPGAVPRLIEAVPFLLLVSLVIAVVTWAFSAVADRLDGLLAVVYLVPVTLGAIGAAAARGDPTHPVTLLVVPIEALLAFAPAGGPGMSAGPAAARIAAFAAAWSLAGVIAARARLGLSGPWGRN